MILVPVPQVNADIKKGTQLLGGAAGERVRRQIPRIGFFRELGALTHAMDSHPGAARAAGHGLEFKTSRRGLKGRPGKASLLFAGPIKGGRYEARPRC
jgi:hypothetical protein